MSQLAQSHSLEGAACQQTYMRSEDLIYLNFVKNDPILIQLNPESSEW